MFTKPAIAGRVKTRLAPILDPERAAALHAAFVWDLSERLDRGAFALWTAWALRDEDRPEPGLLSRPMPFILQEGRDLGERLFNGLRRAVAAGYERVAAIGTDLPTLGPERVEQAFSSLDRADVALGPAADGGYYLFACRHASLSPGLFAEIAWSTEEVLDQTLERCAAADLTVTLLEREHDVDTPDDLRRMVAELALAPGSCPRTEALLSGWGLK